MTNLGVKALLSWVNSITALNSEIQIDDLQDGAVLVKLIHILKKREIPCFSDSFEDRVRFITEFLEGECKFNPTKGTPISWDSIKDGKQLTVEISKVLLLLFYHDMMNDRHTLSELDCDAERELANMTDFYVSEKEGCVYLNKTLDAHLTRRYLPVCRQIFHNSSSDSTSTSNLSTTSSVSDDEAPVFLRTQKVGFVGLETVASSSVSKSPLAEVMNTPKFQLRKMRRQMIKERESRDDLEKQLASTITLITQKESHINQLQYRLDKVKEEQRNQEQTISEQITELEAKNDSLQLRLNELLKENKDLKSTSIHMERKVDELTGENGDLSFQMRALCSKLAVFEAENGQLTQAQASAEEEWRNKTSHLQSELNQATTQKELLYDQVQILQGKISCLEEELNKATKEEVGENMGPVMERELLETKIISLKNELEGTLCSLRKAEQQIHTITHKLAECEEDITQYKELLKQQKAQTEQIIQAKDEIVDTLNEQLKSMSSSLQIAENQIKVKEDLLAKQEQECSLQIEELRISKTVLEDDLNQLMQDIKSKDDEVQTLKADHCKESEALNSEMETLKNQIECLNESLQSATDQVLAKENLLTQKETEISQQKDSLQKLRAASEEEMSRLREEIQDKEKEMRFLKHHSSEQTESFHNEINDLKSQVECLRSSLRAAEESLQLKENQFSEQQQESTRQIETLQMQMNASEDEAKKLKAEINAKEEQMLQLKTETSNKSKALEQEIDALNEHIKSISSSLEIAENQVNAREDLLAKQKRESSVQIEELRKHRSVLEHEVNQLKQEIQTNKDEVKMLKGDHSKESGVLNNEIQTLKDQVQCLNESLKSTADQLLAKEELLVQKEMEISQQKDSHQKIMATSEEEMQRLKEMMQAKEEEMRLLKSHNAEQTDGLNQEINDLKSQVECLSSSLRAAEENVQLKENEFAEQQQRSTQQIETLQMQMNASQDELKKLKIEVDAKEEQMVQLKTETSTKSESLQQEIEALNEQIKNISSSLEIAENKIKAKEDLLAKQEQESSLQIEELRNHRTALEHEVNQLKQEIKSKEDEVQTLKGDHCKESEDLNSEIQTLMNRIECLNESLQSATDQVLAKENLLTQKEVEISQQKDSLQNLRAASEEETSRLREEIQAKQEQLVNLKEEGATQSDMLQQEIKSLQTQLDDMAKTKKISEEVLQTRKEFLQQQLSDSEEELRKLRSEIQSKEKQMELLKTEKAEQLNSLHQDIESLNKQVETLSSSMRKAEEEIHSREALLAKQRKENAEQSQELESLHENVQQLNKQFEQLHSHEKEIEKLKASQAEKENDLLEAERKLQNLQAELSEARMLIADKDQNLNTLNQEVVLQVSLLQKAKEEAEANEKIVAELKLEDSKQKDVLQDEIQELKGELETIYQRLCAKEQKLLETQQESAELVNNLQQQLLLIKAELDNQKEALSVSLQAKDAAQALQLTTLKEKQVLLQEKEALMSKIIQVEMDQRALEKRVEDAVIEKDRLAQVSQAMERKYFASCKVEADLQKELEILKMAKEQLLKRREKAEELELINGELKQQIAAKTEAAEHYKAQMEKAVSYYNSKKQLLQKSEEGNMELKQALEDKDNKIKAILQDNQILHLDLEKVQTNEKKLKSQVASLETQLAYADQALRTQNKIHGDGGGQTESAYLEVPRRTRLGFSTTAQVKRSMSSDSLEQSSLENSLNTTRKLSAPGESSTPLVRSSERLAAKRRGLQAESLETLYFTPINTKRTRRNDKQSDDSDLELDSTRKNPTSSVKRRRTTQVINITMSKKTPGRSEDETFYSLHSARSQPNLTGAHAAQPMCSDMFNTPADKSKAASDQLIGLPGYRRSAVHSHSTSTFCGGAENEPDGGPEDWLRIAELQARNKACLPHLKSSYPVESETGQGSALIFTDEELRTGDPSDTIRRASMMPGQLQDSLVSHRHSLMVGHTGVGTRSHRLSLMPGQLPSRSALSSQLRSPKQSSSTSSVHQISPERKTKASCFPRPLTPKNKNVSSGPSSAILHPIVSPADRRQSMMFTIDNTPKSNNYLKKGLNKLRNSTRKSPGKGLRKSPSHKNARKALENSPSVNSQASVGRSAKAGSFKTPQAATRPQRGSQATSRSAKSPGLTASARKKQDPIKEDKVF
ncbi:nuclear mitotic apparatus protein 1 isoform X4 [Poecilia formosa]|uniref:nuclear mitotic apparatus protein 1 isoform X4 n=1 Tax=Poecilia formosa TaxID=48698 RepID=UPI0007B84D4F|nr:PREDICTED: nuclear mitotic apparatus protein 1 isoform X4 [Poecilia formosa]